MSTSNSSYKSLITGGSVNFLVNGIAALIAFGLQIILARVMGHGGYAIYAYSFTVLTLLSTLAIAGMDIASQRFISFHYARKEWSLLHGFIIRSVQIVLLASLLFSLVLGSYLALFNAQVEKKLAQSLGIVVYILPLSTLLLLFVSMLRGLRAPIYASIPRLILRPVFIFILVVIIFYYFHLEVDVFTVLNIEIFTLILVLIVAILFISKKTPKEVLAHSPQFRSRVWINITLPLFSIACFQMIIKSSDVLVSGIVLNIDSAGSYSAASRVAQLAAFGLMAINGVLPALIAKHHAKNEKKQIQRLAKLGVLASCLFSLFSSLVIFIFAVDILRLFGNEFVEAKNALRILAFGQLINAFTGSVGFLLTMTGNQKILFRILFITAVVNVLLCLMLIPVFGLVGGAIATSSSIAISNIVLANRALKITGIDPSIISFIRKRI